MKNNGKHEMGRFSVEIEVSNYDDMGAARRGDLEKGKVRKLTIQGIVDSGAARLVLPQSVVTELGLPIMARKAKVRYADGRRKLRSEAEAVHLQLQGRHGIFTAIVEPKRDTALIGAIVLEDLDFLVDSGKQCLVPRDPDFVVSEIE